MGYILQYVADEQDIVGWGLTLWNRGSDEPDIRGYVGCSTAEEAVALFLAESPGFSKEDIVRITPILDCRVAKELLAVSSGDYSDYQVWAVFDDKKKANQYRDQLALVEYSVKIAELPLNPNPPDVVRGIEVRMNGDGNAETLRPARHFRISDLGFYFYSYRSYEKHGDRTPVLVWRVHTEDPRRAIKVVNEIRAQLIAVGAWGDSSKTEDWAKART